jgi:hypothetical protein
MERGVGKAARPECAFEEVRGQPPSLVCELIFVLVVDIALRLGKRVDDRIDGRRQDPISHLLGRASGRSSAALAPPRRLLAAKDDPVLTRRRARRSSFENGMQISSAGPA